MFHYLFLCSIPIITGFIGWITNWLAVRMLFRPRKPLRIFGRSWQGLIPKRQAEIARRAAEIIEKEILNHELLRNKLEAIDFEDELGVFARQVVYNRLGDKFRAIPVIGSFLNEATLTQLAKITGREMRKQAPYLKSHLAHELENRLPIGEIVQERIATFEIELLEEVVNGIASKEFRAIEIFGAVLGFAVGAIQLLLLLTGGYLGN